MLNEMLSSYPQPLNKSIRKSLLVGYDTVGYGKAGDIIPNGVEQALHLILTDPSYASADDKSSVRFNRWVESKIIKVIAIAYKTSSFIAEVSIADAFLLYEESGALVYIGALIDTFVGPDRQLEQIFFRELVFKFN